MLKVIKYPQNMETEKIWLLYVNLLVNQDFTPTLPNYSGTNSKFRDVKEVDRNTKEECSQSHTDRCQTHKARVGYWNGGGTTNQFMNTDHLASGNHITRWSGQQKKIWKTENRKHIFIEGKWHHNTQATEESKQKLIHVESNKVPAKHGDWKDMVALCKSTSESDATKKSIYCPTPN